MTRFCLLMVVGWVSASCVSQTGSTALDALGPFLDDLMVEQGVPGVGFAVFDEHGLRYEHVSGVKSAATPEPIDRRTAFEAASISKPVFAAVVLSLTATACWISTPPSRAWCRSYRSSHTIPAPRSSPHECC